MARCENVIQFPGANRSSLKARTSNLPWYSQILKFGVNLCFTVMRRLMTFWTLVLVTVGNTLFAIGCGIIHLIFRLMAGVALLLGFGYAFFAWLFVVVGKAHADPHIWEYLGRFEINMLILFTVGIALELALTMGKGWLYAQFEKARPLMTWGLR
jgi:hypothetical protein